MTTADDLAPLVGEHLPSQRWYASAEPPGELEILDVRPVLTGDPALLRVECRTEVGRYQLMLGLRAVDDPPAFTAGHEGAVLGVVETDDGVRLAYDGLLDGELLLALLGVVAPGAPPAEHVRPLSVEQSNTSVVYDDERILKVFRRLGDGPNLDIEVTEALHRHGFVHVAEPLAVWREGDDDLAFLQRFLAGGLEGWAMALTSLRDLYATGDAPELAGGDFASEACRLGEVTASLHLAMAAAFGATPGDPAMWAGMVGDVPLPELAGTVERFASVAEPGQAIRIHGDFHLGQTMRTDDGWYLLDFEGEPARTIEERRRLLSPLKDVAGMLRSFHYASEVALTERGEPERASLQPLAEAWVERNRAAFLEGYQATPGIDELLPPEGRDRVAVLAGFEVDKAIYELAYERSYRPDWEHIPLGALQKLADG